MNRSDWFTRTFGAYLALKGVGLTAAGGTLWPTLLILAGVVLFFWQDMPE